MDIVLPRELQVRILWMARRAEAADRIRAAALARSARVSAVARAVKQDLKYLATDPRAIAGYAFIHTVGGRLVMVERPALSGSETLFAQAPPASAPLETGCVYGRLWLDEETAFIEVRLVCPREHAVLAVQCYARRLGHPSDGRAPRAKLYRPRRHTRLWRVSARFGDIVGPAQIPPYTLTA